MMCGLALTQGIFHETLNSSKEIPASYPAQACEKNTDTVQKKTHQLYTVFLNRRRKEW